jgi:hypothetical protein
MDKTGLQSRHHTPLAIALPHTHQALKQIAIEEIRDWAEISGFEENARASGGRETEVQGVAGGGGAQWREKGRAATPASYHLQNRKSRSQIVGTRPLKQGVYTLEPPNNGHGGDEHFVHCSEVVPSSEVLPLSTIIILTMNNDITDQG